MTYSISNLLEGKYYRSRSFKRSGQNGIIKFAKLRTDCWRTIANNEEAYQIEVQPQFVLGQLPKDNFYATVYVNVKG